MLQITTTSELKTPDLELAYSAMAGLNLFKGAKTFPLPTVQGIYQHFLVHFYPFTYFKIGITECIQM